jgi:transcription initiation factor IIE alpha subunit
MFPINDKTLYEVASLFGKDSVRVIEVLKEVKEITDTEIATWIKTLLNTVRKALYMLYNHSHIALRRTRDEETRKFIYY